MDCFARDDDSSCLWEHFDRGKNVLMLAPRRIGKTVLLNRLREEGEAKGYRAIVLDVQGFREERAFFQQMCAVIQEELGFGPTVLTALTERLRQVARGPDTRNGDWRQLLLQTDWRDFASHLLGHLSSAEGSPWLVLVDELPVFTLALLETHGMERVHDFLYGLRNLRHTYRDIRWLYTGSIGMDTIARRHSIEGALNDLDPYSLKPFSNKDSTAFLADTADSRGRQMAPDAANRVVSRLGWLSPYYLEKIAEEACYLVARGQTIGVVDADRAVEAMLGLDKRTYWSTWREHLDRNFPEVEQTHLYTVLATVARSPEGVASSDKMLSELNRGEPIGEDRLRTYLDTLVADGYLAMCEDSQGSYRFRMGLLREWWLRYVVVGGA